MTQVSIYEQQQKNVSIFLNLKTNKSQQESNEKRMLRHDSGTQLDVQSLL
jgi:hypothetical protein